MTSTSRYTSPGRHLTALRRAACLALVVLCGAVPAVADARSNSTPDASASGHRVYFRSVLQGSFYPPHYRPRTIRFGERSAITGIKWSRWNGSSASGRGVLQFNSCRPDCATARPSFYFVRITLSRVRHCNNSRRYEFTRFAFHYLEGPPAGVRSRYAELHPC